MGDNQINYKHIYLEYPNNNAPKFWECIVDNITYTVRYGGLGKRITTNTKNFETCEKAMNELEKKKREKLKHGYIVRN